MSKRRVVVTGMGMLSPLAASVEGTWQRMFKGESGIAPIQGFDASTYTTRFAGEVTDFELEPYLTSKDARKMDTFIQYGIVAGHQAIDDSGLDLERVDMTRCGVAVGSGIGGLGMIEKNHIELLRRSPGFTLFRTGFYHQYDFGQSRDSIGFGGQTLRLPPLVRRAPIILGMPLDHCLWRCGCHAGRRAEQVCTPLGISGFNACKALSTRNEDPQAASRPWDTVVTDSFWAMVRGHGVEEYEHAKARGANILAELVGFGMSDDAYHMTLPPEQGEGAEGKCKAHCVTLVSTVTKLIMLTPTVPLPPAETSPKPEVSLAARWQRCSGEPTKSMIGHLLGAAGAVEAIFSVLAIRDQVAPPTINLQDPEPEVSLNLVPNTPQEHNIEYAISNSFGCGGTNGSLLFKRI